jgi:BirA family biotin operon repressor/biotin-[acetyl-CoA-carboxylase] ligase
VIGLNVDWTDAARAGRRIGHAIEAHAVIGSTNDRARELLDDPAIDGIVVVADAQSAGRGRRDRRWFSPAGRSLSMSAAVRPRLGARDAWQLAFGTALATAEACESLVETWLKWPNDVVASSDAKVGGILIETIVDGERLAGAVIGIGLNLDWRRADMPAEIRDVATSLADLAPAHAIDRVGLFARLLDALSEEIGAIEAGRSPLPRYRARCRTLGADVTVAVGERTIDGRAVDLDDDGALVVETGDGRVRVASGEVTAVRRVER